MQTIPQILFNLNRIPYQLEILVAGWFSGDTGLPLSCGRSLNIGLLTEPNSLRPGGLRRGPGYYMLVNVYTLFESVCFLLYS